MEHSTIEKTVNPWIYMAERWNLFASPGRPSADDISNYKSLLYDSLDAEQHGKYYVLVLGSTPEIRDMLAEDDRIQVVIADITVDMMMSMSKLMKHDGVKREIWIKSSWIDVPSMNGMFDAVISDLVICNVPLENHTDFYKKIGSLMKPTGHWINRVYSVDANTRIRGIEDLLSEFCQKDNITNADINNFRSLLGLYAFDQEAKLLNWSLVYDGMKRYEKDGHFVHSNPKAVRILEGTYDLFKPFNKKYFLDTKDNTEKEMFQYFDIKKVLHDESVADLHGKSYDIYDLIQKQ